MPAEERSIAARVRAAKQLVEHLWSERLRQELADRAPASHEALIDNIPKILDSLVAALEPDRGRATGGDEFERHAEYRIDREWYSGEDVIGEYVILRKVVFAVLEDHAPIAPDDRDAILEFFDQGMRIASARFRAIQQLCDRVEMQYLRLIEHMVAGTGKPTDGSVQQLLRVVGDALAAEAAAFLLYRDETIDITVSHAGAKSVELAAAFRGALALAMLPDRDIGDARVDAIETSAVDEPARSNLTRLRIHWLVAVRLRMHARLPAVLCLGFRNRRQLDPVERHLLEMLGDRLALLLTCTQLRERSQEALGRAQQQSVMLDAERKQLERERKQRDDMIAAISHDLKTPLSAARLGAEMLRQQPPPEAPERLAEQILRSINRTDAMVHDLLDTQRIRAGKRFPLQVERYRMNELVDEVVRDMELRHGERFVVEAEPDIAGYWSREGMRRAVENLLTNAIKYGDPRAPITIKLRKHEAGEMALSVHNEGPAIRDEDQQRIFEPFERAAAASPRVSGWGIGLTLTRAIVEAHGGAIRVESTPSHGTTFTIHSPMDARPFSDDARPRPGG